MEAAVVGGAILLLLIVYFWFLKSFLYICGPNEILIFSGRRKKGQETGFRVIFGGRAYRTPILEQVDRMDLSVFPVHIHIEGAFSRGNIPLRVHAIANVKISSDPKIANSAIERFLGQHPSEIRRVAKETLEGNLRGILATMTPEEVNEDRLKFAERLAEDTEDDLGRLGLHLDTLKIQNVSDDQQYLDSIGRKRIAEVVRDAEIAESDSQKASQSAVAEAEARGRVAHEEAEALIKEKENALRQRTAELEALVQEAEEQAKGGAEAARAEAAQELEAIRIDLENIRLQVDQIIPAEIQREAAKLVAAGRAAPIAARAQAQAEAMRMLNDAWVQAGEHAFDVFIIQQLDQLLDRVAESVRNLQVDAVALIDGGDSQSLASYVSAYPRIVSGLLAEIHETLGIDLKSAIKGDRELKTQPAAKKGAQKALSAPKSSGFDLFSKTTKSSDPA